MKMTDEMECQECWWTGDISELVALTDDPEDRDFSYCPNCEGRNIIDGEV